MSDELFKRETELLAHCRRVGSEVEAGRAEPGSVVSEFGVLTGEYEKLLRESRRMVRISDRNEAMVRETNKSLAAQKAELEAAYEELKRTQAQLVQAEKLASLGQLVAGVAHEINTPVGIVLTAATSFQEESARLKALADAGKARKSDVARFFDHAGELASLIVTHAQNAAALVHSFKRVSVDQVSDAPGVFQLGVLVEDTVRSLRPSFKRRAVDIAIDVPPDIVMESFPGALTQVLTNLVNNALVHGLDEAEAGRISIGAQVEPEDRVVLTFSDSGKGVDPALAERIFDPFVTTKRGQGGSGLGLNIVFNLVTGQLQGRIALGDGDDRGATFVLTLPRMIAHTPREGTDR